MKTFKSPDGSPKIGEFTYEGCRYSGIESGSTFSVLSDGLAAYLNETFPFLVEAETAAPVALNEFCCSKCNKDCHSKFMKERHEKVCTEPEKGLTTILRPSYIFWNYVGLDRTQIPEDQMIPDINHNVVTAKKRDMNVSEPIRGVKRMAMIGRTMQQVTTDNEGVDWYGPGIEDDTV